MGIKYCKQNPNSIFASIKIREDYEDAFDNAILLGMKNPEDWMYMNSYHGRDYFKHICNRVYRSYPQHSIRATLKKTMRLLRNKMPILENGKSRTVKQNMTGLSQNR